MIKGVERSFGLVDVETHLPAVDPESCDAAELLGAGALLDAEELLGAEKLLAPADVTPA